MKCLERAQLFAYAHQMLEAEVAERVRAHLDTCAVCRATVAEYQRLETVLDEWKPAEPSPWFDARVRHAVKSLEAAPPKTKWAGLRWGWLATASVAVLVVTVSVVTYRSRKVPGPVAPVATAPGLESQTGQAQRASEPTQPAPQPFSESHAPIMAAKKAAAPTETANARKAAGPLIAERMEMPAPTATAQAGRRAPSAADQANRAALQTEVPNPGAIARSEAAAPALSIQAPAPNVTGVEGAPQGAAPVAPAGIGGGESKAMPATSQASRTTSAVRGLGGVASQGLATRQRVLETPATPLTAADSLLSRSSGPAVPPPPGLLETFLDRHPDAVLVKKALGTLEGREGTRATFTAVVASDPADPASKAKGLVVQFEHADRKATAYIDDDRDEEIHQDSLRQFQESLERMPKKDEAGGNWRPAGSTNSKQTFSLDWDFGGHAENRQGDSTSYCCPRFAAITIAWYKRGEELGLVIFGPHLGMFWFPGDQRAQVVEMVAAGRAFLNAN